MDRLTRTVRAQVALGRLLALGGPGDAVWITEHAAAAVLRAAAAGVAGVRLGGVSLALDGSAAGPDELPELPAAAPVGALPYLPVRIGAGFEAASGEPLPAAARRLRSALLAAAEGALGMPVAAVDLRVTGLLEEAPASPSGTETGAGPDGAEPDDTDAADTDPGGPDQSDGDGTAGRVAEAVRAVPGVLRLARRLPGFGTGVTVEDAGAHGERWVRVQIAVGPDRSPLDVARAVAAAARASAAADASGPVTAVVVIT